MFKTLPRSFTYPHFLSQTLPHSSTPLPPILSLTCQNLHLSKTLLRPDQHIETSSPSPYTSTPTDEDQEEKIEKGMQRSPANRIHYSRRRPRTGRVCWEADGGVLVGAGRKMGVYCMSWEAGGCDIVYSFAWVDVSEFTILAETPQNR